MTEQVHIDRIRWGDTIIDREGVERTVGKRDIRWSSWTNTQTFRGDSFHSGRILVTRILFKKWSKGGSYIWATQS